MSETEREALLNFLIELKISLKREALDYYYTCIIITIHFKT